MKQRPLVGGVLLLTFLALGVAWFGLPAGSAVAAQPQLPPRPTLTPTAQPTQPVSLAPQGAYIRLLTSPPWEQPWSVVQWQGADGIWHDVEGWRGEVQRGTVKWWVDPRDFGTGPFRWVIENAAGESDLVSSPSFHLPTQHGQTLIVTIQ